METAIGEFSMAKNLFLVISLLPALLLTTGCQPSGPNTAGQQQQKYVIAVIPKGATHEHWQSVHAGAIKAARELTAAGTQVEVIWQGPLREDDREQQIQTIEGLVSRGVDGIVLAPLDSRALVRPVEEALRAKIPTLVFDSALVSNDIVSYVATDNEKGGRLAAARMGELLKNRGKVLMLRYQEGSAATEERERGFVKELAAKYPGVELVSSDQYAGATRDTAKRASENLLNRYGDELQGIFTPNESSTAGMLLALQDIKKAGQVVFVGFDKNAPLIDAMRAGQIQGIVVQNPINMGYLSVKTIVEHLRGQPVQRQIDTGVELVTPADLDDPRVRELLYPSLDEYLK
ncbi:MAG: substrate-binding domain-containing protein [Pyrinomonadaceae bacterium]